MKRLLAMTTSSLLAATAAHGAPPAQMDALGAAAVFMVQPPPAYNSWPMIQTLGGRLVCAYSRGSAHTTDEAARGVYVRVSDDGAKTWSEEHRICNSPEWGEVTVGKGLDESGAMLLWIRRQDKRGWGAGTFHDLWRTADGLAWEKIALPDLDPHPIQITDVFEVPGKGLVSLWFAGSYDKDAADKSWGLLSSSDGGLTWTQRTVERGLSLDKWPTEPCGLSLGGGRILCIARSEGGLPYQFQITSEDGGETWKREKTNISDVFGSTPSLIHDAATGRVFLYYYQRGARLLKRRVADAAAIFGAPLAWPEPETLSRGHEERPWDAGNVNVTALGGRHFAATYTGTKTDAAVFVVAVPVPPPPHANGGNPTENTLRTLAKMIPFVSAIGPLVVRAAPGFPMAPIPALQARFPMT